MSKSHLLLSLSCQRLGHASHPCVHTNWDFLEPKSKCKDIKFKVLKRQTRFCAERSILLFHTWSKSTGLQLVNETMFIITFVQISSNTLCHILHYVKVLLGIGKAKLHSSMLRIYVTACCTILAIFNPFATYTNCILSPKCIRLFILISGFVWRQ